MKVSSLLRLPIHAGEVVNECAREQWLERTLLSIPSGLKILDAGAGTQRYRKFCGHLQYLSQDFGQYDGRGDSSGLQSVGFAYGKLDIVSDIINIPQPDASFDAILCVEVFEHLQNPILAVREFARLLKPGGCLVLTAPFCSLTHFAPYHYTSGFSRYWYQHHLISNGFNIEEITANGGYFDYLAQEMGRLTEVATRYAGGRPKLLDLAGVFLVRRMLRRFRRCDTRSSELLCFGYHVLARRR